MPFKGESGETAYLAVSAMAGLQRRLQNAARAPRDEWSPYRSTGEKPMSEKTAPARTSKLDPNDCFVATKGMPAMGTDDPPRHNRPLLMEGRTVGLALMVPDDVPVTARWNQDLEFTANIGTPGEAHSVEMRQEFYQKDARPRADNVVFAVVLLTNGQLVGFGGLFDISRALTATLFVGIGERGLWGKGLGSEATRLVCEYGFFFRNLYSIKVEVNGYNQRAIRVYERLGFRSAGRLRGVIMLNGKRYDQIIMDLLRKDLELEHVERFRKIEQLSECLP
jgi:RimJ/RimL family protein N-acetyltransferase